MKKINFFQHQPRFRDTVEVVDRVSTPGSLLRLGIRLLASFLLVVEVGRANPSGISTQRWLPSIELTKAFFLTRSALRELEGQRPLEALKILGQALALDSSSPRIHYNLGVVFEVLGELDKAEASYKMAEDLALGLDGSAPDHLVLFYIHFNRGVRAGKEKKTDLALEHYQRALRLNSDSLETKINIELLMQDQQEQKQQQKKQQQQDQKDQQDQKEQKGQQDQQEQKNQKDQQEQKDKDKSKGKDQKDQKKEKPEDKDQGQDPKAEKDEKEQQEQKSKGEYERPKPQEFKSEELTPSDVNKILDEIRQQEQKIRSEFQRKESKEKPREKSW